MKIKISIPVNKALSYKSWRRWLGGREYVITANLAMTQSD